MSVDNTERLSVAVVIPTYDREQVLVDTIREVQNLDPAPDEILVIDQTLEHEPQVTSFLEEEHERKRIRWIRHQPPNASGARNRAILETRCDLLLNLDDDILLPQKDLVERHRRLYDSPAIWAVCGAVLMRDGQFSQVPQEVIQRRELLIQANAEIHTTGIPMIHGGHHSVRRERAIQIGGFDESYVGGCNGEDLDFGMRLGGEHVLKTSQCAIIHLRHRSGGTRTTDNRKTMPEWQRTVSPCLTLFRYARGYPCLLKPWILLTLRSGPCRRNVVYKPWRLPWATLSLMYSIFEGWRRSRGGVISPFVKNKPSWLARYGAQVTVPQT